ncbi:MAG: type II toxin-antitoxin system VapC family toxin [Desulfuromonadaceae bacterium]|nr:type II toxin-antitoxin system VapC family toxin [Desulfuromonadaceae bacterium]
MGSVTIGLDTCVLVYYLERHPNYFKRVADLFEKIEAGEYQAVVSMLALTELLVPLYRAGRGQDAIKLIRTLQNFPNLHLVPIAESTAAGAARYRADYGLKTPDALHLASATHANATIFYTNDHGFKKVDESLIEIRLFLGQD